MALIPPWYALRLDSNFFHPNMNISRRNLSISLAVLGLAPSTVRAQSVFDEGIDYRVLRERAVTSSPGKVEVLEFFWYACPFCYQLESHLDKWKTKGASDVVFRKVHVAFRDDIQQKLFYALSDLGQAESLGPKVFEAIHQRRMPMTSMAEISSWAKSNGLDAAKLEATMNSFSVQTQQKRANALVNAYRIDGVPVFGIQGRYITSPAMVGGNHARALQVVDHLVALERKALR